MKIGGITDQLTHQIIDRRYQHVAALAQIGIGAFAAAASNGEIARDRKALNEMLTV